jgi:serine/threonine-protein kinase
VTLDEEEVSTTIYDPLVMQARGRIGRVLRGKWRLDALLGVGGMASVSAASCNGRRERSS